MLKISPQAEFTETETLLSDSDVLSHATRQIQICVLKESNPQAQRVWLSGMTTDHYALRAATLSSFSITLQAGVK